MPQLTYLNLCPYEGNVERNCYDTHWCIFSTVYCCPNGGEKAAEDTLVYPGLILQQGNDPKH